MGTVTTLTIAAEHPALAGHFPGEPIVPGVLLLDEMVRAVEADGGVAGAAGWQIGTAKFLKPVRPGETLTVEHERLPNGSLRFSVARAGEPVAQAVLVPRRRPRAPDDDQQTD
jgi:3-hydroxymyristoyl/3-hydroxydecanoyl-(acyl carrier protein) dehydratase